MPIEAEEEVPIAVVSSSSQTFSTSLLGIEMTIECSELNTDNGVISNEPAEHLQATLLYDGCVTEFEGEENPACEPEEGQIEAGVLGHLTGHEGGTYVLLEALEGKSGVLAELSFGPECAIGESIPMIGQVVLECTGAGCEKAGTTHGAVAAKASLFADKIEFEFFESEVEYHGEATLELAGEYKGLEWSGFAQGPGTKLCKQKPPEDATTHRLKCAAMEGYSGELKGELSSGITEFQSVPPGMNPVISCNETTYKGTFNEDGTPINGITEMTFTSEVGGMPGKPCTSNLAANPSVKFTVEHLPYRRTDVFYQQTGNPQALIDIRARAGDQPVRVLLEVNNATPPETCKYTARPAVGGNIHIFGSIQNGAGSNPSILNPLTNVWIKEAGGAMICPAELRLVTHLTMRRQGNNLVYVAAE